MDQLKLEQDLKAGLYNLTPVTEPEPGPDPEFEYDVVASGTETLPAGEPARVEKDTANSIPNKKTAFKFFIPQGAQGLSGGGSGGGNQQAYKIFNVMEFGAKGDGSTNDTPAFMRATAEAIKNNGGKIEIPPPNNFYRFNDRWDIQGGAQIWIDVQMWGCKRGSGIVYMGGNNNAAIEIVGLKAGSIDGLKVKVGNASTNVDCVRVGTEGSSNSTAGISFEDVEVEVGSGVNNRGFVTGLPEIGNGDVSQILFENCTAWGMGGLGSAGQYGFANVGPNTLQITVVGGGVVHLQEGVRIERGGGMYFFGFGGSHVKEYFHILGATNLGVFGGRFEGQAERILRVDGSSNACTVKMDSLILGNFRPPDGKIVVFDSPGTLKMDNFHCEESQFTAPIISLGGSGGAFHASGGSYNCSSPEMTQATAGWRQYIKGVRQMSNIGQATGWFNDK